MVAREARTAVRAQAKRAQQAYQCIESASFKNTDKQFCHDA
jgi:hypothetical protein